MIRHIPNLLCFMRGLGVLPLAFLLANDMRLQAVFLVIALALSDGLDGWLARRMGLQSPFGAWLDQLADKIFIGLSFVLLCFLGFIGPWGWPAVALMVGRDLFMGLKRAKPHSISNTPVHFSGKLKTATQLIVLLLLVAPLSIPGFVATLLLWFTAALTLGSLFFYK